MEEYIKYIESITFVGLIALFMLLFRLKRGLKAEIVDPDVERLESLIKNLRHDFEKELERVKEDGQKLSEKLDKKFDELNRKLDKNSQAVSNMQGMITAIFNGLRNTQV